MSYLHPTNTTLKSADTYLCHVQQSYPIFRKFVCMRIHFPKIIFIRSWLKTKVSVFTPFPHVPKISFSIVTKHICSLLSSVNIKLRDSPKTRCDLEIIYFIHIVNLREKNTLTHQKSTLNIFLSPRAPFVD